MASREPGRQNRLLEILAKLIAIPDADLQTALDHSCNAIADVLHSEKVDAFLYDDSRDCLVALGTTSTALSSLQKSLGLDVLQVSNGGRVVSVYQTGKGFVNGRVQDDAEELRGVKAGLGIQSQIGVPLEIGGRRRGAIMIASLQPDFFQLSDLEFAESVAQWVAVIAHRSELVREITRNAVEQGRRKVAEELITVLAHDLRNYIGPISTRLHLLRTRAKSSQREEDVRDAELAMKGVERLNRLITDILDVARLDQGMFTIALQPVDLGVVSREIAKVLSTPEHELLLNLVEDTVVAADPARLRQCLENLISNAIQHSPSGAPVRVLIRKVYRDGKEWGILDIHNEGPGIPSDLMPRIFERFASGPGSHGLGLGLYLARRIAIDHGGDLTVRSDTGAGTRFRLCLPCFQEHGDDGTPAERAQPEQNS